MKKLRKWQVRSYSGISARICNKNSANIPEDIKSRYNDLINERVHSEGKWGSVDKALNEIEKLLDEKNNKEDQSILLATKEQLLSMQQ